MRLQILQGDALAMLRELPDASVQCCVTSPPYWGLRDYGTAKWEGGDDSCDHRSPTMRGGRNEDRPKIAGSSATNAAQLRLARRSACGKCGAVKIDNQLGLEKTPKEYVAGIVAVFREVRRVLKDDGTLWMNLGDSYANDSKWGGQTSGKHAKSLHGKTPLIRSKKTTGLKGKDLVGIPWMVAFALRADGWYLRSDIIWHKPNPMPESVTDRPTKSHEYLFLLSKSQRYYYDAEAIAEPASNAMFEQVEDGYEGEGRKDYAGNGVQNPSDVKSRIIANARKRADRFGGNKHNGETSKHSDGSIYTGKLTRNKRSVWTVMTQSFREAHFATFPPDLIKPCILAGSKSGDTILDPFGGSGTTGMVALEFGRNAVLIELNPEYCKLIERRCDVTPGLAL